MLMKLWRDTHINIKVLLILCLVCGIGFPLLDKLLWYTDDADVVRHRVNQAAGIACGQNLAHSGAAWTNEQIKPVCDCVGERFTSAFTPAEMKRLRKHKDEFAPPFEIAPTFEPQFEEAMKSCRASSGTR